MNYNENKCLDLENEYPPIDPTFLATNASSDVNYITLMLHH